MNLSPRAPEVPLRPTLELINSLIFIFRREGALQGGEAGRAGGGPGDADGQEPMARGGVAGGPRRSEGMCTAASHRPAPSVRGSLAVLVAAGVGSMGASAPGARPHGAAEAGKTGRREPAGAARSPVSPPGRLAGGGRRLRPRDCRRAMGGLGRLAGSLPSGCAFSPLKNTLSKGSGDSVRRAGCGAAAGPGSRGVGAKQAATARLQRRPGASRGVPAGKVVGSGCSGLERPPYLVSPGLPNSGPGRGPRAHASAEPMSKERVPPRPLGEALLPPSCGLFSPPGAGWRAPTRVACKGP